MSGPPGILFTAPRFEIDSTQQEMSVAAPYPGGDIQRGDQRMQGRTLAARPCTTGGPAVDVSGL